MKLLSKLRMIYCGQPVRYRYVMDPGTLEQRLFRAVTKPVIPPINITSVEKRLRREEQLRVMDENNMYRKFLIERAKEEFFKPLDEKMLLVFQPTYHKKYEIQKFKCQLFDEGMLFKGFPVSILREAAKNTCYETFVKHMLHVNVANYYLFADPTPEHCKTALNITRKASFLILLGGLVQHRLMTVDELNQFADYSSIGLVGLQGQVLGVLESGKGLSVLNNLNYHQTTIVQGLKHLKQ